MFNIQEDVAELFLNFVIWASIGAYGLIDQAFAFTDITDDRNQGLWQAVVGGRLVYEQDGDTLGVIDHPGLLNIVVGAMIPIFVIFIGLQLIMSLVRKSSAGFLRAAVMMVTAIPSVYIAAGVMWFSMGATSSLSQWILGVGTTSPGGEEVDVADGPRAILSMFGLHFASSDTDDAIVVDEETGLILDENAAHFSAGGSLQGDAGVALGALLVILFLLLAALFLALMMMFRLIALLSLATFLPVAVFSLTWEAAKPVAAKFLQVTVALLIAEPAAAVILRLGGAIGVFGEDWINIALGLGLLLVAGIMPILTMTVVSFMTGGAGDSIDRGGAQLGGSIGRKISGGAGAGVAAAGKGARAIRR